MSGQGSQVLEAPALESVWHSAARRRITDLVALVRLPSCLAGGASVLLGIHLSRGATLPDPARDIIAIVAMMLAVATANVFNDVRDVRIDAIDKPHRPLPSQRVPIKTAARLAAILALAAAVCSVPLGGSILLFMVVLLALGAGYSLVLKNTVLLGNCTVALCASSPILFGAMVAGPVNRSVAVAMALAFAFMLCYETLKTIVDRRSDAAAGVRTFATVAGLTPALGLLRGLIVVLTAAACVAYLISAHPLAYFVVVTATFVLPAWSAVIVIGRTATEKSTRVGVFLMRIAWFLGVVALWLLR